MLRRLPRGTEKRFVGGGNAWIGDDRKYRGWKLTCACGISKTVTSHNAGGNLPPNMVIKKFTEAGWLVSDDQTNDLCPKCYREYVFDRRNRPGKTEKAIEEAEKLTAETNRTTADHRPIDPVPIKNKAHELALLAQLAADDHDWQMLNDSLDALIALVGTLPEETFDDAAVKQQEKADRYRTLKSVGYDVDKDPEFYKDPYFQHGHHIDTLAKPGPVAVNSHPVSVPPGSAPKTVPLFDTMLEAVLKQVEKPKPAVAPPKPKRQNKPEPEPKPDDYDKWLAEQQMLHDQQKRRVTE